MAQFYKVLKADPLGDPWTPNQPDAKPIQNYWCQVEGEELAVSIGKQVPNTITPGESVYGDLMKAQSQKGTNYWKFKSQKVPDGVQRPANSPAQAQAQQATGGGVDMSARIPDWFMPFGNMLIYVHAQLKAMDGDAADEPTQTAPAPSEPATAPSTEVEQIGGEPISEDDKAMLDGIFGGGEPAPAPEPTTEPEPEV